MKYVKIEKCLLDTTTNLQLLFRLEDSVVLYLYYLYVLKYFITF